MKEYYRNYDPEEKDQIVDDKLICKRRVLHIVSTALSFEQMKDAILFTFDDHPIIPKLVRNQNTALDEILEEKRISLEEEEKEEMEEMRELQDLLNRNQEDDIVAILKKIKNICNKFVILN